MPLSGTDSSGQYCDLWTGCGTGDCANDPNCYVGDTDFNPETRRKHGDMIPIHLNFH
jgi:hypothetical protein